MKNPLIQNSDIHLFNSNNPLEEIIIRTEKALEETENEYSILFYKFFLILLKNLNLENYKKGIEEFLEFSEGQIQILRNKDSENLEELINLLLWFDEEVSSPLLFV